eukprot:13961624-Alexandrium_andersonii.AAC.1
MDSMVQETYFFLIAPVAAGTLGDQVDSKPILFRGARRACISAFGISGGAGCRTLAFQQFSRGPEMPPAFQIGISGPQCWYFSPELLKC